LSLRIFAVKHAFASIHPVTPGINISHNAIITKSPGEYYPTFYI